MNRLSVIGDHLSVNSKQDEKQPLTDYRSPITVSCFFILVLLVTSKSYAQNELTFQGQLSGWTQYNDNNDLPVWLGARYIPQLNYKIPLSNNYLIDFETSTNIYGNTGIHPFDTTKTDGNIKPYRIWARYSTNQLEIRLGLQKINFGSASMLRPLMWFDQIDPRDPLKLTDGVWGLLGRYYFLNNANVWLWALYGNDDTKTWEIGKTNKGFPEFGGRFQSPVSRGEAAVSYHYRVADTHELGAPIPVYEKVNEHRIGIDGKWDVEIGVWFEGVWINKTKDIGIFTNHEIYNGGIDYTFDIGNGLNVVLEHLLTSYDEEAFTFSNTASFSGMSVSYPLGIFDNINAIVYYNWENNNSYNFINWQRQYDAISIYIMAYWNPEAYQIPQQQDSGNLFSGKGVQLMFVFNH